MKMFGDILVIAIYCRRLVWVEFNLSDEKRDMPLYTPIAAAALPFPEATRTSRFAQAAINHPESS
jgi:hypothetical protein